ncbi:hypothetical protein GCM10029964_018210 [Kibdelosporangium lantanae]
MLTHADAPFGMNIGTVWGNLARPLRFEHVVLVEPGQRATHPGPDDHGETFRVDLRRARVRPRLPRGDQRDLLDAVEPTSLHAVKRWFHGQPGRDLDGDVPVLLDHPHARHAGDHGRPRRRHVPTQRGGSAQACHNHVHVPAPRL